MFMTPLLTPPSSTQSRSDWRWVEVWRTTDFPLANRDSVRVCARVCVLRPAQSRRWISGSCARSRATGSTGVTTATGETSKTWLNKSLPAPKVNTACDLRAKPLHRLSHKPSGNTLSINVIESLQRTAKAPISDYLWVTGGRRLYFVRNTREPWFPFESIKKCSAVCYMTLHSCYTFSLRNY